MSHKGFTLIELLIAITVFSIILAGLYPVFSQITTFNQENYMRTALIDNLRAGMDRLEREIRDACFLYKPGTPLIYNQPMDDNVSYNSIVFSHRDPQNPDQNEYVRYSLTQGSYSLKIFPDCKQLIREVWNDDLGQWVGGNPVTEPTIKEIVFKKQGQLIKVCIVSYVKLRLRGEPQEYIYLGNIAVRNNLIVGGCAP
ncbi:MAG: prepilin-type N-terminal cleavage/methylation domain-containing protein [Caldisericia bacterium]|nr:prepilin-type N-terminal cleavage/methylation domain-containing protein [Caldisericia bacterium]